jgi:hypothetical protein
MNLLIVRVSGSDPAKKSLNSSLNGCRKIGDTSAKTFSVALHPVFLQRCRSANAVFYGSYILFIPSYAVLVDPLALIKLFLAL